MDEDLDQLARRAKAGDRDALEALCRELQHLVYRLALRFYSEPANAEDATQEILLRVVTNLDRFEHRSKVTTWVYTIASRHLLRSKRQAAEDAVPGPVEFARSLDESLTDDVSAADEAEYRLLAGEVRLACTYGMLLTLSRPVRIAYLLGDLLGMTDTEGAGILEITPAAFRQRLARARRTMRAIIAGRCGLVDAGNPCRCSRQVRPCLAHGIVDPGDLRFSRHPGVEPPISAETLDRAAGQLDLAERIADVYRSDPAFLAPAAVWRQLTESCPDLVG